MSVTRRNKLSLFLHLVWATWDREPMLTSTVERAVWRCIEDEAVHAGCRVLALNGMPDHVHLVVRLPSTISIAELVKQVKGASSRFANDQLKLAAQFKWQGSYGAFTLSRPNLDEVVKYVKRQKEHHANQELWPDYEEIFEEIDPTQKDLD